MIRNIDKMYYNFGYDEQSRHCHECQHFKKPCWNKQSTKKVVGFDDNGAEIVERESFLACGLIDKPFPDESIPGQITIFEKVGEKQ